MSRKRGRNCPTWEIGARKELAYWKQNLKETRTLVQAQFTLDATKKRAIDADALVKLENLGGEKAALYKGAMKEVQGKMDEWEDKISIIEEIVFAQLLLKGAERNGINVKGIAEDPLSIYIESKRKKRDIGIMVHEECPLCTSFVQEMEVHCL